MVQRSVTQGTRRLAEDRVGHYERLTLPRMSQTGMHGRLEGRETAREDVREFETSEEAPSIERNVRRENAFFDDNDEEKRGIVGEGEEGGGEEDAVKVVRRRLGCPLGSGKTKKTFNNRT